MAWSSLLCRLRREAHPTREEIVEVEKMTNELISQGRDVIDENVELKDLHKRAPDAPNIFRLPKMETYRI